jgi:hypothetical protein
MESLSGAVFTDDPGKIDLREPGRLGMMQVIHAIPYRLWNPGKGS